MVDMGNFVGAILAAGVAVTPSPAPTGPSAASAPARAGTPIVSYPLVELRQYTLHPGQRDALIALFERAFVESQEAVGMKVIGQYRDLDNPNRYVWLRGFGSMESRAEGLEAFYFGPVWQAHREAANATIIDSDNVLLLRAPTAAAAFGGQPPRPPLDAGAPSAGLIVATLYYLRGEPDSAADFFAAEMAPRLREAGIPVLAWFVPETRPNNFPRLPIRENARVLVWFSRFDGPADHQRAFAALAQSAGWAETAARLDAMLTRPPEVLRLQPAARSELR